MHGKRLSLQGGTLVEPVEPVLDQDEHAQLMLIYAGPPAPICPTAEVHVGVAEGGICLRALQQLDLCLVARVDQQVVHVAHVEPPICSHQVKHLEAHRAGTYRL